MSIFIFLFSSFFNIGWTLSTTIQSEEKIAIQNVEAWIGTEKCIDDPSEKCIEKIPNAIIIIGKYLERRINLIRFIINLYLLK